MDQVCLVIPVLPGKTADAKTFTRALDRERRQDYDASERRIGIQKEAWFLATLPAGDNLVAYMEAADFGRALTLFSQSRDPFDVWFKGQMLAVTGLDLENIPAGFAPPELLSSYIANT